MRRTTSESEGLSIVACNALDHEFLQCLLLVCYIFIDHTNQTDGSGSGNSVAALKIGSGVIASILIYPRVFGGCLAICITIILVALLV